MDERTPPGEHADEHGLTRRGSLLQLGGVVAAALGAGAWTTGRFGDEAEAGTGPAGVASGAISCVLAPEQTEGPYYIEDARIRRDITEGKRGVPLTLRAGVVDARTCRPVKGAAVDVWHADAGGAYSGFGAGAAGRTFLRGMQRTNAGGVAVLQTIYPGWYPGRTVHIHVKVHLGGNVVHTGQLYFPDAVTDAVYRRAPYDARPGRSPRNAGDSIWVNGGKNSTLRLSKLGSGAYVARITMGVNR